MRFLCAVLTVLLLSTAAFSAEPLTVTTFVGSDGGDSDRDGVGTAARLQWPYGLAVDANGNILVANNGSHTIRHITPAGVVTTLAGVAGEIGAKDGRTSVSRLQSPHAVAVDSAGNVYVPEPNSLRKISPSGIVTTLLSWPRYPYSWGIAVDSSDNVFLTDYDGRTIRKITPGGTMTTVVSSTADAPRALTIDSSNNLYFSTASGIYKSTPGGVVTPIASIGNATALDLDASGNLYVATFHQILKVTPDGTVTSFAGTSRQGKQDGTGLEAGFDNLEGLALSPDGSLLYVTDGHTVRKITVPGAVVTTFVGKDDDHRDMVDATGVDARFAHPSDVVLAPDGNLYVADSQNHRIRRITPAGVTTTLAGTWIGNVDGTGTAARFGNPERIALGYDGPDWGLYVTDVMYDNVRKVTQAGVVTTIATGVDGAHGIAVAADGDIYVAELDGHTIKKIDMPSGTVSVFAGASGMPGNTNATGTAARFANPAGLAIDNRGNLFVADSGNHLIRQIVLSTAEVRTLAGNRSAYALDGIGAAAGFHTPNEIHAVGNDLYVSDSWDLIRLIEPGAVVTTVAGGHRQVKRDGTGNGAGFREGAGIGGESSTNLYICDRFGNTIRKARVAGIADVATASNSTPLPRTAVQLDTNPRTATSWTWSIERRPTGSAAELSSATTRNPTFTPDVDGLYTFVLRAEKPDGIRYSTVSVTATGCADPLASVVASTATSAVCANATNGTAAVSVSGGTRVTYQWGYRTTPGGAITPIAGETSPAYAIDGTDFGGRAGTRYLVVTVTPSCGVATVSNQLPLDVTGPLEAIIAANRVVANSTRNVASVPDAGAGATYAWSMTNGVITAGLGTRSIEYTAGTSGTVALTVTVSRNGCASASGKADVPIHAPPARRRSSRP